DASPRGNRKALQGSWRSWRQGGAGALMWNASAPSLTLMRRPLATDRSKKVPSPRGKACPLPTKDKAMAAAHHVLIVDDDAVNRRMAHALFQKLGWCAETVDSGAGALRHLATQRYDLLLLDISMPGMNGMDVCQRIRADQRLRALRVIAYTAHALLEQQRGFL